MVYRQRNGDNVWHWTEQCAQWPEFDFRTSESPTVGISCPLCQQLDSGNSFRATSSKGRSRSKGAGRGSRS